MKPYELRALAAEIEQTLDLSNRHALEQKLKRLVKCSGSHPTTNLQDAVDAVPEGWDWDIRNCSPRGGHKRKCSAEVWAGTIAIAPSFIGKASEPAAALCAAILRAKAAEMEGEWEMNGD